MSSKQLAQDEAVRVLAVAVLLTTFQIILNTAGMGGISAVATMYFVALTGASWLVLDENGLRLRAAGRITSSDYMTQSGINAALVLIGLALWFVLGVFYGLDQAISTLHPEESLREKSGLSIIVRIIYTLIAHLTVFSFSQFWLNLFKSAREAINGN